MNNLKSAETTSSCASEAKAESKSLFKAFGFSFTHFITPTIIKFLYGILLVAGIIFAVLLVFKADTGVKLIALLALPVYLLLVRIFMEMIIVIFKIASCLKSIDEKTKR